MNARFWLAAGSILAGLAVAAGAFGAHELKNRLEASQLETFEVAVRYQMYHALALLGVGLWAMRTPSSMLNWAGVFFLVGIIIFSGMLYLLVFTGVKWLGAIVPIGGLSFIAGWVALAIAAWRQD